MLDMGKRIKVQCESCGSIFNKDFQKKHENALHDGKRVKIKVPGAPANPFVASKSSNMKSNLLENVSFILLILLLNSLIVPTTYLM
jgi:hypothetical protein